MFGWYMEYTIEQRIKETCVLRNKCENWDRIKIIYVQCYPDIGIPAS